MGAAHSLEKYEKLHVMQVGPFRVLFSAECDAVVEEAGNLAAVEMKTGNPRFFGTKVMFQMMASKSE